MYKKILIINPFGIGDVLFTTPVIHALKDAFSGVKIGYLSNRRTAPILKCNPYVDDVYIYERDEFEALRRKSVFLWLKMILGFLNQIKKEHFGIALDFSLNTQYGFFSWYAGIKQRIGYDFKKRGRFLTQRINLVGYSEKHIVEYYADLLKYAGLDLKYKKLELYFREEDKKQTEEILSEEGIKEEDVLVGIFPGAGRSWGKDAYLKHWPAENFADLADKILEKYQAKIIIMGDFSENKLVQEVIANMRHPAINICGKITILGLAALLKQMKLVITNDGGPLHMAVALDVPTVSFFGPVDEKVYGPYPPEQNRHIVLRKALDCSPCYRNFRLGRCLKNKECLTAISLDEALAVVNRLLG